MTIERSDKNAAPQENKAGAASSGADFKASDSVRRLNASDSSSRGLPNEPAVAAPSSRDDKSGHMSILRARLQDMLAFAKRKELGNFYERDVQELIEAFAPSSTAATSRIDSPSIPSQRLASSEARPGTTPDEPVNGETHQRRVAPRSGSGEGVSQADSRERPALPLAPSATTFTSADHLVKIDDGQSTHAMTAKEWLDLARRNFEAQRSDRELAALKEEIRSNITAASAMLALPYGLSLGQFCEKVTDMFAFWSGKKP